MEQVSLPVPKLNPWMLAFGAAAILAIVLYYETKNMQKTIDQLSNHTPVEIKKPCNCHETTTVIADVPAVNIQDPPTAVVD